MMSLIDETVRQLKAFNILSFLVLFSFSRRFKTTLSNPKIYQQYILFIDYQNKNFKAINFHQPSYHLISID
jgi:hypothetical protein